MEKIHQKQNLNNFSKIPYSKASINKEKFKLSIPFSKQNNIKLRNDSIKDTLEGSMIEAQTINNLKYYRNDIKIRLFLYVIYWNKNHLKKFLFHSLIKNTI